jgi:hypothetical protein
MPADDPIPANDYTALAVQLGVIQEGQRNTLDGINDIKETLTKHGDRLGSVESRLAVVTTRVDSHDVALNETRQDSRPQKGRWANIASAGAAIAAFLLVVLDRFYLPSH